MLQPPCLKWLTVRSMRSTRIRDLHALRARFTDQLHQGPIATLVKAVSPTSRYLSRGGPRGIAPNTIASTTRRSNRMLEYISATSGMRDGVSSNVGPVTMKTKYVAARSTSRSTATRTQLSSQLTLATLQLMPTTTPKGPQHLRGRSEHF